MTLLQMQYFCEVCRNGSTLKASQALNVSQSTVSTAIRTLEAELGVVLFERTSKGLIPNEAGSYFLKRSQKILRETEALSSGMGQLFTARRPIRLGIPVILNFVYWVDLYFELKQTFPDMEFEVVNRTVPVLLDMLKNHALDGVLVLRQQREDWPYSLILKESQHSYVSMSVSHPLAGRPILSYLDLLPYPVLGYNGDTLKTQLLQREYQKYGAELKYAQRFDQLSTLIQFLRKNAGIAFLTRKLTNSYPDLTSIPLEEEEGPFITYLVWSKYSILNNLPKRFFQIFQNFFEELEE